MSVGAKVEQLNERVRRADRVINDLVRENYELRSMLAETQRTLQQAEQKRQVPH